MWNIQGELLAKVVNHFADNAVDAVTDKYLPLSPLSSAATTLLAGGTST